MEFTEILSVIAIIIALFLTIAHIARKLNNNEQIGGLGVIFLSICCILGYMFVTWLISAGIMIPLEYGYKKLGWFVFVLPVIVVVIVGWIASAIEGKRLP